MTIVWSGSRSRPCVSAGNRRQPAGSPAAAQSLTDRFKSLFGGKSDEPAPSAAAGGVRTGMRPVRPDLSADVTIRAGASTYAVAAPGKQPVGNDLRFRRPSPRPRANARSNGGEITARIGIQGRVIAGPAGAPTSVEVPLRVAVVQGGVSEKTIATKVYQTTVDNVGIRQRAVHAGGRRSGLSGAAGAIGDSYIFYIGFDPQALKPEPKPRGTEEEVNKKAGAMISRRLLYQSKPISSAWRELRSMPLAEQVVGDRTLDRLRQDGRGRRHRGIGRRANGRRPPPGLRRARSCSRRSWCGGRQSLPSWPWLRPRCARPRPWRSAMMSSASRSALARWALYSASSLAASSLRRRASSSSALMRSLRLSSACQHRAVDAEIGKHAPSG